jgi:AAA domain
MPPRPSRGVRKARTASGGGGGRGNAEALEVDVVSIEVEQMSAYDEPKNICVYGPSGHGKTTLVSSAPNATFLTTEKGLSSAKMAGSSAQIMRAYDWEHVVAGKNKAIEMLGKDDWLIVDSGTKMQVLYMRWILKKQNQANSVRSLDIPSLPDHQQYQNGFKRFCDEIMDAHFNTIMVFGEMEIPGEDEEMQFVPHIEGGKTYQIMRYITSQFDVGIRYSVSKSLSTPGHTVRLALAQPAPPYWAKDRYTALGDYQTVEPGDFTAMAEFIEMMDEAMAGAVGTLPQEEEDATETVAEPTPIRPTRAPRAKAARS